MALVALVCACAGRPPPPAPVALDEGAAGNVSPEQLCERYVALADASTKLDAERRAQKLDKCVFRARASKGGDPQGYACLVRCTFRAESYAVARGCPYECASASATPSASAVSTASTASTGKHYMVYRDELLELEIVDKPGPLVSNSAPPPLPGSVPPKDHPFLTAPAFVPEDEGKLRQLLDTCKSTAEYLEKLRALGYRVVEVAP